MYRINSNNFGHSKKRWTKQFRVGNLMILFKLDTGADVNCIPIGFVKKLGIKLINGKNLDNFPVFDYNGNKIKIFGIIRLICYDLERKTEHSSYFLVVDDNHEPILGLEACEAFGLIKRLDVAAVTCLPRTRDEFLKNNKDLFNGIGKFPGTFSIKLKTLNLACTTKNH